MNINPDYWVAISFTIFIALIFIPTKKAILKILDDKIVSIATHLEDAERIKNEAEEALENAKGTLECIEEQRRSIIRQATDRVARLRSATEVRAKNMMEKRIYMAQQSAAYHKARVLTQFKQDMLEQGLADIAKDKRFLDAMAISKQLKLHQNLLKKFAA